MIKRVFRKIAFGDWVRIARGTIEENASYLEIGTDNEAVLSFLCRCRRSGEVISNPVVWVDESYYVHSGAFKVIHMDDQGTVLRKVK
ncbi:hypothetical protein [Bhargavaea beijingensis]|uniref:Uncharacterized protein n=1 Tax=Bhargavaea beijingensis TaxID=426756 RepID=A0A1G7AMP4_9BACL|nr:hypothetical protein [Bhargavaea beijingensis]MCW1928201.1 hypothetical protein [Bhargavaea beijingensis]RSK37894.1 hypothetical protein EJA12_00230 [Bhargavaea beijingensis]SDE16062.1 hypothetical protein SAMN04488126_10492 [Bhargavaea beijingensis]